MAGTPARLTWREWVGLGAALLAAAALFLPWTTLSADTGAVADALASMPPELVVRDAWYSGFFAWFPPLLLVVAGIAVTALGRRPAVRSAGLPQLWLVAAAVALALSVLGWFAMPWQFEPQQRALLTEAGVTMAAGLGRYLAAVAVVASTVTAALDVRAARAGRPGRGRPR